MRSVGRRGVRRLGVKQRTNMGFFSCQISHAGNRRQGSGPRATGPRFFYCGAIRAWAGYARKWFCRKWWCQGRVQVWTEGDNVGMHKVNRRMYGTSWDCTRLGLRLEIAANANLTCPGISHLPRVTSHVGHVGIVASFGREGFTYYVLGTSGISTCRYSLE